MEGLTMSEVQALAKLMDMSRIPYTEDRDHALIVRNDEVLLNTEVLCEAPIRTRREVRFLDFTSFLDYLKMYKSLDSRCYVSREEVRLVVDHPGKSFSDWEQHVAVFPLTASDEAAAWLERVSKDGSKQTTQTELALLFERRARDVLEPSPTELLEVALTLEAKKNVDWKSGTRLRDGSVQFMFEETVNAKAGQKGELEIPQMFRIFISLYEGTPAVELGVKLRFRLNQGQILFVLEWEDLAEAERATRRLLKEEIESLECPVFLGAARSLQPTGVQRI
jgi:uncharacterized protein YfdQ (DUF2303 family)